MDWIPPAALTALTATRRRQTAPRSRPRSASTGAMTGRRAWGFRHGSTIRSPCSIAHKMGTDTNEVELARLPALVNVAMADVGIAAWESKYHYEVWRPVTAIREADEGTGPTGLATATRTPSEIRHFRRSARLPAISWGRIFTPPFPAYPSGHAAFGGALFESAAQLLSELTASHSLSSRTN